jgi:hypothetical protein
VQQVPERALHVLETAQCKRKSVGSELLLRAVSSTHTHTRARAHALRRVRGDSVIIVVNDNVYVARVSHWSPMTAYTRDDS